MRHIRNLKQALNHASEPKKIQQMILKNYYANMQNYFTWKKKSSVVYMETKDI